jgi:hypothetical protein
MDELEVAYRAWRDEPIPRGADDERLASLDADLRVADTWVAEDLIPFIEAGQLFESAFEVLPRLNALLLRARVLVDELDGEDAERAISTARYLRLLVSVYELYLSRTSRLDNSPGDSSGRAAQN